MISLLNIEKVIDVLVILIFWFVCIRCGMLLNVLLLELELFKIRLWWNVWVRFLIFWWIWIVNWLLVLVIVVVRNLLMFMLLVRICSFVMYFLKVVVFLGMVLLMLMKVVLFSVFLWLYRYVFELIFIKGRMVNRLLWLMIVLIIFCLSLLLDSFLVFLCSNGIY